MVRDLLQRGLVHNYTKLPDRSGTVQALCHVVDVVLSRRDIGWWLHTDDDVLFGPSTLRRAVEDYRQDLAPGLWRTSGGGATEGAGGVGSPGLGGGVLALFVNSWLDEQLVVNRPPAFGPYAVAPFLGGASYIMDRATLLATGNPWAQALRSSPGGRGKGGPASPHDAHVLWLRKLLPEKGLPIWIRWREPYECQHLANVHTLNFGRQPDWEPMWALDHQTKHIVEVPGFPSTDVRAALWAGGKALREFVAAANEAEASPSLRVRLPKSASRAGRPWSLWDHPRTHVHYIEIGTSDFDTLLERHVWREEVVGFSIEPVRTYFERLPAGGGPNKTRLNVAISDHDGYEEVFLVRPELIGGHLGAASLCRPEATREAGLSSCLPGWVRGTSSIKRPPQGVRQLLLSGSGPDAGGDERLFSSVLAAASVPCMTFDTLATVYGVGSVDIVKIDAEGFDHEILKQVLDFAEERGILPWQIQFEKNSLSDWQRLDEQVARLVDVFRYTCRMTGMESAACWRPEGSSRPAGGGRGV